LLQIKNLQQKIHELPEGSFYCARNHNRYKWYSSQNHTREYIPKSNRSYAEKLAQKKYYSHILTQMLNEKAALEAYFKQYSQHPTEQINSFLENPGYQDLLTNSFSIQSKELSDWANSSYKSNPYYPEQLIHLTNTGIYVRSKSEAMIVYFLSTNQIPFRYECELQLSSGILYPDFTIRHPKSGEVIYWEHFGKMDDEQYCQKTMNKLHQYTSNHIIPSINLITTYETLEHPLTFETVRKTIEDYFL